MPYHERAQIPARRAERNPTGSNFRIDTTLDFTDCGEIVADVPK